MERVTLPDMTPKQEASWRGIVAVSKLVRNGWCLVGGQMVQLWCWERGNEPNRPTDDGDAVLDIRAHPKIMKQFCCQKELATALIEPAFEVGQLSRRRARRTFFIALSRSRSYWKTR